ncbi:MAG: sigma 54-interacting transcriptional regulator [Candidatus Brocadiia bacterium]
MPQVRLAGPAQAPSANPWAWGDLLLGAELGGCRIFERIGQGAMAAVYKAKQHSLQRHVAIKVVLGTAAYMSPEQCRGERADIRSDIYSLGATLYEMLIGRPPFEAGTAVALLYKHLHEPVPPALAADPSIPAPVAALAEKMMAKEPDQRHQYPGELARDVERRLAELTAAPERTRHFDHRESFRVAEAVLAVVRHRCPRFPDEDAVWEAFVQWRGRGEDDYLRRIRAGGKFIFYSVLQDLYDFAQQTCGENVAEAVGQQLAGMLLEHHMPDLLHTTLVPSGALPDQIRCLVSQFVAGTCGEIYELAFEPGPRETHVQMALVYRSEEEMIGYLERSRHDPQAAFADSFRVFRGALRTLPERTIQGFGPEQFVAEQRGLSGRFRLTLKPHNRFHYENITDILLDYVRRLREREGTAERPAPAEAGLHVSEAMKGAWERIRKAAACEETVMLCGESGTGKSYYARVIHEIGPRREGPFVEVGLTSDVGSESLIQSNLFGHVRGAFTGADEDKQGLFALAHGGTIFLDEIGDASPELQAKLLRVIEKKSFKRLGGVQETRVDVRIIAATNRDLAEMMRQGAFREDLYYRLNVIQILLPPLRDRREDSPALVQRLFEKVRREAGKQETLLTDDARTALGLYDWPGNIRELENALRRAVALTDGAEVRPQDLPEAVRRASPAAPSRERPQREAGSVVDRPALRRALASPSPSPDTPTFAWPGHVDHARREYLAALIEHHHGNLREIAKHWDRTSEHTLLKIVRQFGLEDALRAARRAGR